MIIAILILGALIAIAAVALTERHAPAEFDDLGRKRL